MKIRGTLVVVSSLSPNMFYQKVGEEGFGFLQFVLIPTEEKLRKILDEYERVVSYIRHPPTNEYLKKIRQDIEVIGDKEYKIGMYEREEILTVALTKRPQKGSTDVKISGFEDLAFVLYRFVDMISY